MILEACVETFEQCREAQKRGADRIELCADLAQDGLTPSRELIKRAVEQLDIPIRAMIRPRPGDFVYSQGEIEEMKIAIDFCKSVGAEGVVFGACTKAKTLDLIIIAELAKHAFPLKVTVHKAIDTCHDPVEELKHLKELGTIDAVLTSGKELTAIGGKERLKAMVIMAEDQIEVIACGKVTHENLTIVHELIGAKAYHGKRIVSGLERETP